MSINALVVGDNEFEFHEFQPFIASVESLLASVDHFGPVRISFFARFDVVG